MKQISQKQKSQAYCLLKLQAKSVLLMFIVLFAFFGIYCASYALMGASISLVANLLCIHRMFVSNGCYDPKKLLSQFYLAEMLKLGVSVVLLAAIFKFLHVNYLFLIIGYSFALLSFWIAPLLLGKGDVFKLANLDPDAEQVL